MQKLKHKLTLRVLSKLGGRGITHPKYDELFINAFYTLNEILKEEGYGKTAWAIRRGERIYLLHPPTRRLICEVGVIAEPAAEFCIVTLRGIVPESTMLDGLIEMAANRGARRRTLNFKERSKDG